MWRGQLDLFPTVSYAPTLYQHGNTLTNWASAALDMVHEQKLIIIGCSIGGSCALEIAAIAPERVECLVLVGTKAHRNPDLNFMNKAVEIIRNKGPEAAWDTYWAALVSKSCDTACLNRIKHIFGTRTARQLTDGTVAFHTRPSRVDLLASLPCKTVFITGSDDIAPGPQTTFKQARLARRSSYHEFPNCGHYVPLEAPDAFNAMLRQELTPYFQAACAR